jgi:ubiquinone/menaquinone biosynthesis C-methylase UbiE
MNAEFNNYAPAYSDLLRDPIRDSFGADPEFFHRRKLAVILDFLARRKIAPKSLNWLDIGCGRGELLSMGASLFGRAVGCDPSPEMMAACKSVQLFAQTSATELPFPDCSFELVTAACVYHHVAPENRTVLTRSVQRVLKPEGIFCMFEHNPVNPVTRLIVARCPVDRNAELLTARQASQVICSSKLETLETCYYLYLPERIFRRIGRVETLLQRWPFGGQFAVFGLKRP